MTRADSRRRIPGALLAVLLILPIALFFGLVWVMNTGLPTEDDFHGLFGFVVRWQALPNLVHRLQLLVTFQHNEYKMPLPYSLLGLELMLTHEVSIPLWIWVGNLLALTMLIPLWLSCAPGRTRRERLLYFVPVVWLVMSLGYAETVDFALSGLQVVLVMTLSLLTVYCITHEDRRLNYLGCAFALLACGTYANAFLLMPIGVAVLWRAGRWAVLAVWVGSFVVSLSAFLYQYRFLPHARPNVAQAVLFFFSVVGGPLGFHRFYAAALLLGVSSVLLLVYLARHRADRVAPFAFWVAVWLMLGFVLTTYGRASGGPIAALASRYKIYGDLLLAALYLQVLALLQAGRLPRAPRFVSLPVAIVLAIVFGVFSDALGWHRLHARKVDVVYGMDRFVRSGGVVSPMVYPPDSPEFQSRPHVEEEARQLLKETIRSGLYHLPTGF